MKRLAIPLLALALTACGSTAQTPQTPTSTTTTAPADKAAACKAAMVKQFEDAMTSSKTGTRPKECQDIDDATLQKFAEDILTQELGSATTTS